MQAGGVDFVVCDFLVEGREFIGRAFPAEGLGLFGVGEGEGGGVVGGFCFLAELSGGRGTMA